MCYWGCLQSLWSKNKWRTVFFNIPSQLFGASEAQTKQVQLFKVQACSTGGKEQQTPGERVSYSSLICSNVKRPIFKKETQEETRAHSMNQPVSPCSVIQLLVCLQCVSCLWLKTMTQILALLLKLMDTYECTQLVRMQISIAIMDNNSRLLKTAEWSQQ